MLNGLSYHNIAPMVLENYELFLLNFSVICKVF
jgi:hypothetical protein